MTLRPTHEIGKAEFIALTAFIMMLTALAIDIMLPAFDALRDTFALGDESTATAQIVTFFFLGQVGQIIFGPLSDRFGRLPVIRVGFALYISGCVVAALSPSLGVILAARFVAGLGAAALRVCAIAGVRDRFAGDQMARTMSFIMTIFLFVPILAPIFGSVILSVTSWQGVFLTPPLIAAIVLLWSFRLNESLPPERRLPLDVPTLVRSTREIANNRAFVRYTAITTVLFAPFSSYIGSSERMITEIFGQPSLFVWIFAGVGIMMALFTFLNAQFVDRFGAQRTIRTLLTAYLVLACVLLVLTIGFGGLPNIFLFFVVVALLQTINVGASPSGTALALETLGSTAGMAAAINGTVYIVFGSIMGSFIDRLLVDTVTPLAVGYVIAAAVSVALVYSGRPSTIPAASSETAS